MTETYLYERKLNKNTDFNVWLAFPECESFSLSSLGYLWLFKELDEDENIFVERICTDTKKTKLRIEEVDAIGFSFSFDMDFLKVFEILEKYNIPFKSSERRGKNYPLIYAGGPVVTTNPEPFKDIFDFMVIGDGEFINKEALYTIKENPKWKMEMRERELRSDSFRQGKWEINSKLYNTLAEIEGIYVPKIHNFDNPVKKSYKKLDTPVYTPILSDNSFFQNTFIIETSRGCYNCCGFCTASYLNLPARFVEYEKIIEAIELGLKHTNKIALLGALVSAHPRFDDICDYIYKKVKAGANIEMSISSMRANTLTPDIIKTLVATGQKHITIAIEAATERLRKVINKNITEEQIFNAVRISKENGLKGVKIYCMLGLPTETQQDIDEFIRLAKDLKKEFKGFDITFSFSTFVPKPHTPLGWSKREDTKSLEKKINYLQKEFHKIGMGAKFSSPKWDYYQTVISRGDSDLTDYLIEVYKEGGKLGAFKNSAKKLGINLDKYTTDGFEIGHKFTPIEMKPGVNILVQEYNRLINKT